MKILLQKFNIQKRKTNSNIHISKNIALTFWYVVLFTWKYDVTVKNALKIG